MKKPKNGEKNNIINENDLLHLPTMPTFSFDFIVNVTLSNTRGNPSLYRNFTLFICISPLLGHDSALYYYW